MDPFHSTARFVAHFAPAIRFVVFAAACAASSATFADCTARSAKSTETAFHSRALSALVAALPPVPAGAREVDAEPHDFRKPTAIRETLCDFSKEGAFSVSAARKYFRKHSEAEHKQLQSDYATLTAQFHALKKTPPDKVAQQDVLRKRSNDAWQAARDAEKAGDKAGAQARNAEYRTLRDQADAIDAQHQASVKTQTEALDKRRTGIDLDGQKVEIRIAMNLLRLPPVGSDDTRGVYGAASPGQSVGLKVHNIAYAVVGAVGPLHRALAAAIDRGRLQAIVGMPLPSETESEAFAARALPVQVADMAIAASTAPVTGVDSGHAAAAITAPAATTVVPQTAPAPAAPAPATDASAAEPLKKAAEAVSKLRGLLGR